MLAGMEKPNGPAGPFGFSAVMVCVVVIWLGEPARRGWRPLRSGFGLPEPLSGTGVPAGRDRLTGLPAG